MWTCRPQEAKQIGKQLFYWDLPTGVCVLSPKHEGGHYYGFIFIEGWQTQTGYYCSNMDASECEWQRDSPINKNSPIVYSQNTTHSANTISHALSK